MFVYVFFIFFLASAAGWSTNTTCSTDVIEARQIEVLGALKQHGYDFQTNQIIHFNEEENYDEFRHASLVWRGKRALLDLSVYRVDPVRDTPPFRVTMTKKKMRTRIPVKTKMMSHIMMMKIVTRTQKQRRTNYAVY